MGLGSRFSSLATATLAHDKGPKHYEYSDHRKIPFKSRKTLGVGSYAAVDEVEGISRPFQSEVYARKTIKIWPKHTARRIISTIQNEVEIFNQVDHPHFVKLVATYEYEDNFAIIMKPVAEMDLEVYLVGLDDKFWSTEGCQLRDQLEPWFGCLVSAINYLHHKNIRHRDIKPHNILVLGEKIMLADFGISKQVRRDTLSTSTGTHGTPRYRAPEVNAVNKFGREADIFSLGAVWLEMIAVHSGVGELSKLRSSTTPYSTNNQKVLQWIETLNKPPRDIPWYPTMLYLCKRMLQQDRFQRPTAKTLWQCWSYYPSTAFPTAYCTCDFDNEKYILPGDINEPLPTAFSGGHRLLVDLLLAQGARINDHAALFAACQKGQTEVVDLLIHTVGNISIQGALQQASAGGFGDIVSILLKKGADTNAKYISGYTALHLAAMGGHYGVVHILLSAGADINATDGYSWTALQRATTHGHQSVARLLVQNGADVDAVDNQWSTALHRAAMNGHKSLARLLIRNGADVNAENVERQTPLHLAAKTRHIDSGRTKNHEVVRLFIDSGANIHARDNQGRTPLHLAASSGHHKVVRLLT